MHDPICTFNGFHLGDNLIHLHFLRALAGQYPERTFVHSAQECHLPQLEDMVADTESISLRPLPDGDPGVNGVGLNAWKNAAGFFQRHLRGCDWTVFHLDWFRHLAAQMGLQSTFSEPRDLLFDYPALFNPWSLVKKMEAAQSAEDESAAHASWRMFQLRRSPLIDFLVVNSQPCSGQFMDYDRVEYFDPLISSLRERNYSVAVTQPTQVPGCICTRSLGLSVTEIGLLSQSCRHHLMVATGPMWPCLNVRNLATVAEDRLRVVFLRGERLDLPCVRRVESLDECRALLVERGLL